MSSQARRRHTQRNNDDSDEEPPRSTRHRRRHEEVEEEDGEEMDVDGDDDSSGKDADQQLAKKLIRYAIACEYARIPIRRDGIKERALGTQNRSFRRIFALAQEQLISVWGMELRELPIREKMTLQEKRKAISSNSAHKTGSGAYILTSILPEAYRVPSIIPPSKIPSADVEATYSAFCALVVSCIWLNGGELSDQKLKRYLSRLNADQNVSAEKTEVTLNKMIRQNYVIKRTERPPVGQDGELIITWHVSTRAREEIGLNGVMGMVREVYGGSTPELEKTLRASLNIKTRPSNRQDEAGENEPADETMADD